LLDKYPFTRNYIFNPTTKGVLHLSTEIRGEGTIKSEIQVELNPHICKLIIDLLNQNKKNSEETSIPSEYLNSLIQTGILIEMPQLPNNINFKCLLNNYISVEKEQLIYDKENFEINNYISIQTGKGLPKEIENRVMFNGCFSENYPVLWVEEPFTGQLMPFWISDSLKPVLSKILNRQINLNDIPEHLFNRLITANIIIPAKGNNSKSFELQKKEIQENGISILKNVINPLQINALKEYYKMLEQNQFFIKGDGLVFQRDSMPNEPTARFFHHQITNIVNLILPQKVKPTYCFVSIYNEGAVLPKHKDREQCEWNISLLLNMEPEDSAENSWPFYIEDTNQVHEVNLGIGDAVIYPGSKLYHWRNKLPDKHKALIFFFHFVNDDFQGDLT
jgi:hypothetical protein